MGANVVAEYARRAAARQASARPAPRSLAEKVPLHPGGGVMGLRDWLAQAQRDLPEWDELRTDAQRFAALEKMFADDAVKAAFLTKLFNVSSLDWNVTPALPDDPRSRQIADFHLFNLQGARGGTRGIVEEILLPGLVRGHSICEMVARPEPEPDGPWRGKRCLAELKAKPHVTVEEDQFGNAVAIVAQTKDGPQKYDPADGFVLFKFLPLFGKPTSDFRAAYRAYRAKAMVVTLWLIGLEKFGQPFFQGKHPPGDLVARQQLQDALELMRSRTFIILPDNCSIDPVQILSGNHAYYQQALDSCDRAIFVAIAGAFLQNITSANRGGPDQRGDSQIQQTTSELFVWHLASCVADTTNDQIIPYWHRLNFAGGGLPKAALGGVNDADLRPGADLDKTLTEIGLPLSKKDAYLRYDRVPPSGPDDVLGGGSGPGSGPAPFAEPEPAAAPPLPPGLDVGPLMTVREVCRTLRVSRSKVKGLTDAGELRYKRFGTTIRVPQRAVAEYLTRCEGAPAGGGAAVPFSDRADFCMVGANAGKPGPCPEHQATPAHKDALAAHAQGVNKTLTSSERGAVSDYIAGLDESVNESLRAGKMPTDRDEVSIVKGLDSMFAKAPPLKEPVNVHRGIRLGTPEKQAAFLADLQAKQTSGAAVEFKAYGSTTTDPKVAEGFLRNKPGGVVFDIEATHGVDVSGLTQVKQAAKEAEFLLPRGSEFDVVGVEPGEPARVRLRQRPKTAAASERPFAEGLDGAGGAPWFARRAQGQGG